MNVCGIILAGGKGTRFSAAVGWEGQKILFPLNGRALIDYTIEHFQDASIKRLIINVRYKSRCVVDWMIDRSPKDTDIAFSMQQSELLSSAVYDCIENFPADTYVLCNSDEVRSGFRIADALRFHKSHEKKCTLVGACRSNLHRHRVLHVDEDRNVQGTTYCGDEYSAIPHKTGIVNAGVLIFDSSAQELFACNEIDNGWSPFLKRMCDQRQLKLFHASDVDYFNVGTKEELDAVKKFLNNRTSS